MKRRLLVDQRENEKGDFWWVVRGGNRSVDLTSEMYPSRSNALRAARGFIRRIAPVPVTFTFWTGDRQPRPSADGLSWSIDRRRVTENIR